MVKVSKQIVSYYLNFMKPFLKPYTVYYRDFQNLRIENCFYALDAYEARTLAMEFNKYISEHPNSIDLIRCEKWYLNNGYLKV